MSKILLTFCIPTYNRPERIFKLINQIISFQSDEIEIIIGDDNPFSNKTRDIVNKFEDPRIVYFQNKNNLGMDGNMLKAINRASGEFVFIMMDDDDVEIESIPWILKTIKENNNLTRIYGSFGDKRQKENKIIVTYGDKLLRSGAESLMELLFYQSHGSGVILKKKNLNLKEALKYNGCLYMQAFLEAQAMIKGDTICTSKIMTYMGEIEYKSDQPLIKNKSYWHPIRRLLLWKYRIQIIYEITKRLKNCRKIRKILLNREKPRILNFLNKTYYFKDFITALSIILTMKISKWPGFWIYLIINTLLIRINSKTKINPWIIEIFNRHYLSEFKK